MEEQQQQDVQGAFPQWEKAEPVKPVQSATLAEAATHGVEASVRPGAHADATAAQDAATTTAIAHERATGDGVGGQG